MKKNILYVLFIFIFLTVGSSLFAQKGTVYISPNNDGVQDELKVPLSVNDKRFIKEWNFVITDKDGKPVRTIGNKISLPEKITFKNFFSRLVAEKAGVEIPPFVIWDGTFDTGEIAPDGLYKYYFSASDDNGNVATTAALEVVVDNTAPEINLVQPKNPSDKIFGEGNKADFAIKQSGSQEDLWQAFFSDNTGKIVKSYSWTESEPLSFDWDGTSDAGTPVADGVYSYRITSVDKAGNTSNAAQIPNIIYSAEKPGTNISIKGSKYFSPNGDGIQDTVAFDVTIPAGNKSGGNSLVKWNVSIIDANGNVYRSFDGTDTAPSSLVFNGKDSTGNIMPEGSYQAVVSASYLNGFEPALIKSPVFVLDITAPAAIVRSTSSIFSPDGDGRMDTIQIVQDTSREKEWRGEILDKEGNPVRSYMFGEQPDAAFLWDGLNNEGGLCEDG
ncbi:MAG: flagellar motor protein MotB, partial [Spirochaetaceae bacterium]|nr:flagellar motor protein MotB [Spirochaetaceae bacterium]